MALQLISTIQRWIRSTADANPTAAASGSTVLDRQTGILYITHDGGTTWTEWAKRVQSAQLPTALAAGGGMKVEGVAGGVAQPISDANIDIALSALRNALAGTAPNARNLYDVVDAFNYVKVTVLPALAAGTNLIGKVQPFAAVIEGGLTELIDKDDTEVSLNDYSKSVSVALGGSYSGEILAVSLYATELGTGAVRANSGYLLVFDADPTVSAGDTALTIADWQSCIAKILVSDWISDTGGGMATMEVGIPFHALSTLYFVFLNQGAAWNDAAGDDEELHMNLWYRRDS